MNGNGNGNGRSWRTQVAVALITVLVPVLAVSVGWNFRSIADNQRDIARLTERLDGLERQMAADEKDQERRWKKEDDYDKEVRDQYTRIYEALTDVRVKLGSFPDDGAGNGSKRK
jgi:hypothetical protein